MNRLSFHKLDNFFNTSRSVDHNLMRQDHLQGTKLNDELLESLEIQIVDLSFVEDLDVDVSDESVDLRLWRQVEEPIIFQQLA